MTQRIYVVDDEDGVRNVLKRFLERAGYEVNDYPCPTRATIDMQDNTPHIVITDINMPGVDGYEFGQHVKNSYGLPVLFISGDPLNKKKIEGEPFMGKPFNGEDLVSKVEEILRENKEITRP